MASARQSLFGFSRIFRTASGLPVADMTMSRSVRPRAFAIVSKRSIIARCNSPGNLFDITRNTIRFRKARKMD